MRLHPALLLSAILSTSAIAEAHPTVVSGPAASGRSQKITFGVAHGCEGADTVKIRVEIPDGISGVRALTSDFGKPSFKDDGTNVTEVTWEKPAGDRQAKDFQYYELTLRARVNAPAFTTVLFRVFQTCLTDAGEIEVPWIAPPGGEGEPAPSLVVVPARVPGWNRYVLGASTTVRAADLPIFLGDALIVWRGTQAFSTNASTREMIAGTPGVTLLTGDLRPDDVLWVKY
jgi:periplasmic copper chaperone A